MKKKEIKKLNNSLIEDRDRFHSQTLLLNMRIGQLIIDKDELSISNQNAVKNMYEVALKYDDERMKVDQLEFQIKALTAKLAKKEKIQKMINKRLSKINSN